MKTLKPYGVDNGDTVCMERPAPPLSDARIERAAREIWSTFGAGAQLGWTWALLCSTYPVIAKQYRENVRAVLLAADAAPVVDWTTEPPTENGFYWMRRANRRYSMWVEDIHVSGDGTVCYNSSTAFNGPSDEVFEYWPVPIPAPPGGEGEDER